MGPRRPRGRKTPLVWRIAPTATTERITEGAASRASVLDEIEAVVERKADDVSESARADSVEPQRGSRLKSAPRSVVGSSSSRPVAPETKEAKAEILVVDARSAKTTKKRRVPTAALLKDPDALRRSHGSSFDTVKFRERVRASVRKEANGMEKWKSVVAFGQCHPAVNKWGSTHTLCPCGTCFREDEEISLKVYLDPESEEQLIDKGDDLRCEHDVTFCFFCGAGRPGLKHFERVGEERQFEIRGGPRLLCAADQLWCKIRQSQFADHLEEALDTGRQIAELEQAREADELLMEVKEVKEEKLHREVQEQEQELEQSIAEEKLALLMDHPRIMQAIPASIKEQLLPIFANIARAAMAEQTEAGFELHVFDFLRAVQILRTVRYKRRRQRDRQLLARIRDYLGDNSEAVFDFEPHERRAGPHSEEERDRLAVQKSRQALREGNYRKAMQLLEANTELKLSKQQIKEQLVGAHVHEAKLPHDAPVPAEEKQRLVYAVDEQVMRKRIGRRCYGRSSGPSGMTFEHLSTLTTDPTVCSFVARVVQKLINNNFVFNWVKQVLLSVRLVPVAKSALKARPIAVSEVLLTLAEDLILLDIDRDSEPMVGAFQYALRPNGQSEMVNLVRNYVLDPTVEERHIVKLDIDSAFPSVDRMRLRRQVVSEGKHLQPIISIVECEYSEATLAVLNGEVVRIPNGIKQGSSLSMLLFALYIRPILEKLCARFPAVRVAAFADDIKIFLRKDHQLMDGDDGKTIVARAYEYLRELLGEQGLAVNAAKSSMTCFSAEAPDALVEVLGVPLSSNAELVSESVRARLSKNEPFWRRLRGNFDGGFRPHEKLSILVKSANQQVQYLARHVEPIIMEEVLRADVEPNMWEVMESVLDRQISESQALQISLPITMGGCSLVMRSSVVASIAYFSQLARCLVEMNFGESLSLELQQSLCDAAARLPIASPVDVEEMRLLAAEEVVASLVRAFPNPRQIQRSLTRRFNQLVAEQLKHRSPADCNRLDLLRVGKGATGVFAGEKIEEQRVSNEAFRLALAIRLGARVPSPLNGRCPGCQADLGVDATHLLTCVRNGFGVYVRHNRVVRLLQSECHEKGLVTEYTPDYKIEIDAVVGRQRKPKKLIPDLVAHGPRSILIFDVSFVNVGGVTNLARGFTAEQVIQKRSDLKIRTYQPVQAHLSQLHPQHRVVVVPVIVDIRGVLHLSSPDIHLSPSFLQTISCLVAQMNEIVLRAALH